MVHHLETRLAEMTPLQKKAAMFDQEHRLNMIEQSEQFRKQLQAKDEVRLGGAGECVRSHEEDEECASVCVCV